MPPEVVDKESTKGTSKFAAAAKAPWFTNDDRFNACLAKARTAAGQSRQGIVRYKRGEQAEALIAWILESLEDSWHIFNSIKLEAQSDIDHILVGPGGVFCISTKSQRGWFQGTRDGLLWNKQPCPFAHDALRQTMNLKDRFAAIMGAGVPWVQPVLATPFGYTDGDPLNGKVWLVHAEDLMQRIAPEKAPRKLSGDAIQRVVGVLEMLKADSERLYQRAK